VVVDTSRLNWNFCSLIVCLVPPNWILDKKVREANSLTQFDVNCVGEWLNCMIACLIGAWDYWCVKLSGGCFLASLHVKNREDFLVVSPRRVALAWAKIPEDHLCHYAKSRLGELGSPERDNISSRRASLAWARVRPRFVIRHCMMSRPGEINSPKRDRLSSLGETL